MTGNSPEPPIKHSELNPSQLALLRAMRSGDYDRAVWIGAVRSGKSAGAVVTLHDIALRAMIDGEGTGNYIVGGATAGSAERNNLDYLIYAAEQLGLSPRLRGGKAPHLDCGPMGRFYIFGGGNARSYMTVRGMTAHSAYIDEATLCDRRFIETCWQRCSFAGSRMILTANADSPLHWIKRDIIDAAPPRTLLLTTDFRENRHYSEERRQALLSLNPNTADYRRAILNQWAAEEGLIIPVPAEAMVSETFEPAGDVVMDPGTASVCAALLLVRRDYGWLVADEYYWDGDRMGRRTDEGHLRDIVRRWKIHRLVIDPAGASMRAQAAMMGYFPERARNDFDEGVQVANNAIHAGNLRINQGCHNLLGELGSYRWNPAGTAPVSTSPDHAADCLRYAAMDKFPAQRSMLLK